jgi:hypothetical protein
MKRTAQFTIAVILTVSAAVAQAPARKLSFNGRNLTTQEDLTVTRLEQIYGVRLPDGAYWYDNRSGAFGLWNGPAAAILPAGLGLGGPLPANASGGQTLVFVNGRSLHPLDIAALSRFLNVQPGRFWVDAQGYFGYEGGPAIGNLVAIANQAGSRRPQHRTFSNSELGVIVNEAGACTSSGCYYPR